jgi:hypothetical protein
LLGGIFCLLQVSLKIRRIAAKDFSMSIRTIEIGNFWVAKKRATGEVFTIENIGMGEYCVIRRADKRSFVATSKKDAFRWIKNVG